jgi:membrane protein
MTIMTSARIIIRAARQFSADGCSQMGAALAYYALFSTAPLLLMAVMVAGIVYGKEAAQAQLHTHLTQILDTQSADLVATWMKDAARPAGITRAAILGTGMLLVAALGLFLHLRHCLCVIWRLEPLGSSIRMTVLDYLLAILAVMCVGLLLLVSLAVSTGVNELIRYMGEALPGGGALWHWLEIGVSFLLLILCFGMVYRVMSGRQLRWRYIWYGSVITGFLFAIGKSLIGMYLAYTSTSSVYGAAGSLVVFLLWVYYSSQIAFFGAELIQARRTRKEWLAPAGHTGKQTPAAP